MSYLAVGRADTRTDAQKQADNARLAEQMAARTRRQAENAALTGQAKIDFETKMALLNRNSPENIAKRAAAEPADGGAPSGNMSLYLMLAGAGALWFFFLRKK